MTTHPPRLTANSPGARIAKAKQIANGLHETAQWYHDGRLDHAGFTERNTVFWGKAEELNLVAMVQAALRGDL